MAWLNKLWNTIRPASLRRELDEELRLHLELRARDFERQGMSKEEARAEAARHFGNSTLQRERAREMDIAGWIETFFKDLRYAWRQLRRNPVFSIVAVLSLALGIGTNTAIFSVMNSVIFRSLPVRNPHELVMLTNPSESGSWSGMWDHERPWISYQEFLDLREHLTTLSGLCVAGSSLEEWQVRISGGEQEPMQGRLVSEEYFSVLAVQPAIGRVFQAQDATGPGKDPYAVIGYDFWQKRFAGSTDVLGTPIKLNGTTLTVIGVAAPGFKGETVAQNPDFWIPMMMQPSLYPGRDRLHEDPARSQEKIMWLHAFGRMKPEASLASVQAEVNVVFRGMMQAFYPSDLSPERKKEAFSQYLLVRDGRTGAFPGRDYVTSQLKIVLAVAGLVLLIACANVANLLLARATARQREVSVRLSIGASRLRLFRQFLTESLLLSGLGGAAGLLIALGASRILVQLLSRPDLPYDLPPTLDWNVLAFTAGITLLTGMLFGISPALRASRSNINVSLRESGPGVTHSGRRVNLAKVLVIGQVALSLILVVGAGLFLRTLWNLQAVALGYPKENMLQIQVDGMTAGYKQQALAGFYNEVADRMRTVPGVRGVAYSQLGLLNGGETRDPVEVAGYTPQRDEDRESRFDYISPGYFGVLRVPLLVGRDIGPQDTPTSQRVCVVNEAFAKHFLAGKEPIGRHFARNDDGKSIDAEIVGVVKDSRVTELRGKIPPRAYSPVNQAFLGEIRGSVVYEIRTAGEPKSVLAAVRKTILAVNSDAPIEFSWSMEEILSHKTLGESQIARLCSIFGALALLLAATGLYGVLAYGVARRTNEIGIRMALGAGRDKIVGMVLGETAWLVAFGLIVGVIGSAASTHVIAAQLYGLSRMDPLTIAVALVLLSAVALVAGYIPAARAAKVNPVLALRHE